jgi:hypothetical protein
MQDVRVELRGTYRYADRAALERALAAARTRLEEPDGAWLRWIVGDGTQIHLRSQLPNPDACFGAARVIALLARDAVAGGVEAWCCDRLVLAVGPKLIRFEVARVNPSRV